LSSCFCFGGKRVVLRQFAIIQGIAVEKILDSQEWVMKEKTDAGNTVWWSRFSLEERFKKPGQGEKKAQAEFHKDLVASEA